MKLFYFRNLLTLFVTSELISWNAFCEIYEKHLKCTVEENKSPDIFNPENEEGKKHWLDLKNRVVEHVCNFLYLLFQYFKK